MGGSTRRGFMIHEASTHDSDLHTVPQGEFDHFCSWAKTLNAELPEPVFTIVDEEPNWMQDQFGEQEGTEDDGFLVF